MAHRGVICAGRFYTDLVFTGLPDMPQLGTETFAQGLALHAGGGAFITAAHLVALGRPAGLLATLPGAPFNGAVAAELARSGVDLGACANAASGQDPQLTVAMATQGDRAFLTRRCGRATPDLPANLNAYRHLHIGELTTLLEQPDLVTRARAAGLTVSLDCGWDNALARSDLADLLATIDVFLPNAAEVAALEAAGLRHPMAPLTVIKRGADGAEAVVGTDRIPAPTASVAVLDATGAGDAFNAGFLATWLQGQPAETCLAAGNRQGALAVSAPGGAGVLAYARMAPAVGGAH